jgi:hypothetical protein
MAQPIGTVNSKVELFRATEEGNRIVDKLATALATRIRTQTVPHRTQLSIWKGHFPQKRRYLLARLYGITIQETKT